MLKNRVQISRFLEVGFLNFTLKTKRNSNRKLSIVMALSTTFTQCAPETIKFGKITQNKGHFAVQGH